MADELRQKGNAEFTAKNFEAAIKYYDEAIQLDPKMVELYNNRSAANYELRRYEAALEDARRGLKVSTTSKGHMRVGNALWAMGKLEGARDAYDLALSAAPGNQTIRDNLNSVRQLIAARSGTARQHSSFGGAGSTAASGNALVDMLPLYLDVAVIVLAVLHLVGMFLSPDVSLLAWRLILVAFAGRQVLTLKASGLLQPSKATLSKWPEHFSALYAVLCTVGAVVAIPPLHLLLAAMAMYSIVDIAPQAGRLQGRVPPAVWDRVLPQLQKAQQNRDLLIGNAATCEAMLTFMLFFSGASLIFNIVFIQFIKFRYRSDPFSRLAFSALRQTVEKLTKHRLCPPVVDNLFGKLCGLLSRVVTG